MRDATSEDLLETIGRGSPKFFETLVLDLLHAMGYGASRSDLQHVGRSGDGGIDGIVSLDRLGLEKVFVQAKRFKSFLHSGAVGGGDRGPLGQDLRGGAQREKDTTSSRANPFSCFNPP